MSNNMQAQKSVLPRQKGRRCFPISPRESWQSLGLMQIKVRAISPELQLILIWLLLPSVRLSASRGKMLSLEPKQG